MICPLCGKANNDDRPVLVGGVLQGRGCDSCYRKQGGRQAIWGLAWLAVSGRTATVEGLEPEELREAEKR